VCCHGRGLLYDQSLGSVSGAEPGICCCIRKFKDAGILPVSLHAVFLHFYQQCSFILFGVQADAEAQVKEPDKCYEWRWVQFSDIPQPWFSPLRALLESGFEPSADKSCMNVRLSEVVVSESARSGHKTAFEVHKHEDDAWDTPALEIAAAVQPAGHGMGSYIGHTVQRGPQEMTEDNPDRENGAGNAGGGIVMMGEAVVPQMHTSFHQHR
jgi:hypothetical protein